jgi:lipopolysaccharide/colanic/teichoic acid biosynthesis glycosyltransferase
VRPGLTGLAQINGGKLLTPEEKDVLDDWYIRHASLRLDLIILARTAWVIVRGDRRNEGPLDLTSLLGRAPIPPRNQ